MGQKTNPISLRLSENRPWRARWFFRGRAEDARGKRAYQKFLEEDELIRNVIRERIHQAGIAGIEIERTSNAVKIYIKAARPGLVIGQGGKGIEELTKAIERGVKSLQGNEMGNHKRGRHVSVTVEELKRSEISAAHMAQQIAWDLERRMPFRWMMKKYLEQVMQNKEARGAKIALAGRLDGAEIARHETLRAGSLPLQTLRAAIDYGQATAFTTYGTVGVKVWIYKGETFTKKQSPKSE